MPRTQICGYFDDNGSGDTTWSQFDTATFDCTWIGAEWPTELVVRTTERHKPSVTTSRRHKPSISKTDEKKSSVTTSERNKPSVSKSQRHKSSVSTSEG